jgi:periplasmic divalent cation tolerance protein
MTDKIVCMSACADAAEAESLARRLLEKRLAACVNILPGARSIYRWRGAIEESPECLLLMKSRRGLFDQLRSEIERLHSYEVPEVVVLAIAEGSAAYLNWLEHELKPEL